MAVSSCCGSGARDDLELIAQFQRECDELTLKARHLHQSFENAERELPRVRDELSAAERHKSAELAAALRAEGDYTRLREAAESLRGVPQRAKQPRSSAGPIPPAVTEDVTSLGRLSAQQRANNEEDDNDNTDGRSIGTSEGSLGEEEVQMAEFQTHIQELQAEAMAARVSVREGAEKTSVAVSETERADVVADEYRQEAMCLHYQIRGEEEIRRSYAEAKTRMTEEEAPLRDWVDHVEQELRVARDENAELQKELLAVSSRRAQLQRDDLESLPLRQSGVSVKQVLWLERHMREAQAQKVQLLEEISAKRTQQEVSPHSCSRSESATAAFERRATASFGQRSLPPVAPLLPSLSSHSMHQEPGSATEDITGDPISTRAKISTPFSAW